jgi:hypothetical protein
MGDMRTWDAEQQKPVLPPELAGVIESLWAPQHERLTGGLRYWASHCGRRRPLT